MIKNAEKQTDKELTEKVQVIERNKSIKNMLKERKSQKQIAKAEAFEQNTSSQYKSRGLIDSRLLDQPILAGDSSFAELSIFGS